MDIVRVERATVLIFDNDYVIERETPRTIQKKRMLLWECYGEIKGSTDPDNEFAVAETHVIPAQASDFGRSHYFMIIHM